MWFFQKYKCKDSCTKVAAKLFIFPAIISFWEINIVVPFSVVENGKSE